MNRLLSVSALFVFILASCATSPEINYGYPESGNVNNSAIVPVKDYETAGIIIVKSSEVIDSRGNHTGSKITYEMLMLEAQKLNADDILNIRIDVNQIQEVLESSFGTTITRTTYNYTATALAIRYTTVVPAGNAVNYPPVMGTGTLGDAPTSAVDSAKGAVSVSDDSWKRKWVYLGGILGGGAFYYEQTYYYNNYTEYDTKSHGLFAIGGIADVALLDFFSVELILGLGARDGSIYPVLPILAKLGYRFGQMEASFNAGYTIGIGPTLGATFGFHAGPGVLFAEGLLMPGPADLDSRMSNLFVGVLGYKIGIGDKKTSG